MVEKWVGDCQNPVILVSFAGMLEVGWECRYTVLIVGE